LFVKNLSYDTTDGSLKDFFSKFGEIKRTNVLKRDDGKSKGIGFVSFERSSDAKAAMDEADNMDLDGR
jgi:RNA recognition motif-containing protein